MGPLRQLLERGDVPAARAHVDALWQRRFERAGFSAADAEDAAWALRATADALPEATVLWPRLLGLLTRWAYTQAATQAPAGPPPAFALNPLLQWLTEHLVSRTELPWPLRAPALLLLAAAAPAAARDLACKALCAALLPLQRQRQMGHLQHAQAAPQRLAPALVRVSSPPLLEAADAVSDLCAATVLVLESLAAAGDARLLTALLASLLALLSAEAAVLAAASAPAAASPQVAADIASAAAQEAQACALAALHASCRQLGAACTRGAAEARPEAAPTLAALAEAAAHLHAASGACTVEVAQLPAPAAMPFPLPPAVLAGALGTGALPARVPAPAAAATAAAAPTAHSLTALAFLSAAGGGLLEGCFTAARLQPPAQQHALLHALQPSRERMTGALLAAAGTGAVVAGADVHCSNDVQPGAWILGVALGHVWARLRELPPLAGGAPAAVADSMTAAAAAAAAAARGKAYADGGGGSAACAVAGPPQHAWLPADGALSMLLTGALGVGRLMDMARSGASHDVATELLLGHTTGPLFADTQLLARAALDGVRWAPPPQAQPPHAAMPNDSALSQLLAAGRAQGVLAVTAAAAARLHRMYSSVVDSRGGAGGGRGGWLAALPPHAAAAFREVLDRTFVCTVTVVAAAFEELFAALSPNPSATQQPPPESQPPQQPAAAAAAVLAAAAAAALTSLADVQFCALPLRAQGDLVARLSGAMDAAPSAAAPPLLAALPCYPALAAAYAAAGGAAVAVSRLGFLLPLTGGLAPRAPAPCAAAAAVLPYTYLLLKGAPEGLAAAAHAVWGALLAALCERAGGGGGAWSSGGGGGATAAAAADGGGGADGGGAGALVDTAAAMVPYYVDRTCGAPCSEGDVEQLERGLRQVLLSLPLCHPIKAWCVGRLARQLLVWAHEEEADAAAAACADRGATAGSASGTAPQPAGPAPPHALPAATRQAAPPLLARGAAALAVLVVGLDYPLLPHAFAALDELLGGLQPGNSSRTLVLQQLHDTWLRSDDYARKPLLHEWLRACLAAGAMR